jgi:hypothetical protein
MANITITIGGLSATRTYADNNKAQTALLLYHQAYGLGGTTNQQKLEAIIDKIAAMVREKAALEYEQNARNNAALEAASLFDF